VFSFVRGARLVKTGNSYTTALEVKFSHNGRVECVVNNMSRMEMSRRYQHSANEDGIKTDQNQDDSQNKTTKPTNKTGKAHLTRTRSTLHNSSKAALLALILARLMSARLNVISDCDEVYNYWEPLHFALYGTGMQTWEYSSQYALRPWLYIILHAIIAWPLTTFSSTLTTLLPTTAALLPPPKVLVFYTIKAVLGLLSALSECWLYTGAKKHFQSSVSSIFLLMLIFSSGMFAASTALLPSSFSMYALTTAAAALLHNKPRVVIIAAFIGVIWGWSVAGIAFLPYAPYILYRTMFPGNEHGSSGRSNCVIGSSSTAKATSFSLLLDSLLTGLISAVGTLAPLTLIDRWYYGKWTSSLINFFKYNVAGGGDSALYGVESWSYYLRNGFNNLQLVLPLALCITPWLALFGSLFTRNSLKNMSTDTSNSSRSRKKGSDTTSAVTTTRATATTAIIPRKERKWYDGLMMLWWLSPGYIWLLAISLLPHKEERFLYVVYPMLCISGAIGLSAVFEVLSGIINNAMPRGMKRKPLNVTLVMYTGMRSAVLIVIILMGVSRSIAMKLYYGAPMELYIHLPPPPPPPPLSISSSERVEAAVVVCVGSEWHRYPSSFFLPAHGYGPLQFVKSGGFGGLLPRPFDTKLGGAAASPDELNDRNIEEPRNYWTSLNECDYFITTLKNSNNNNNGDQGGDGIEVVEAGDPIVLNENKIDTNDEHSTNSNGSGTTTRWIDNVVAEYSFVENQHSPAWARAFYIPWLTWDKCSKVRYVLLQNPKNTL